MSEPDMSNIMNQINSMLQNNEIPDDIKNMFNNFKNSSSSPNCEKANNNSSSPNSSSSSNNLNNLDNSNNPSDTGSSTPEIDINTILKMKQIMDSMNSKKDDPRANLLMSLKPYLKDSRKKKVDQYVKLFGLGKAFETFNFLGGENKNDV